MRARDEQGVLKSKYLVTPEGAAVAKLSPYAYPGIEIEEDPLLNPIVQYVAAKFDITTDDLLNQTTLQQFVFPRHLIMYMMHLKGYGPARIARIMHRNHSTVIRAVESIKNYLETDHDRSTQISEVMLYFSES